jgi:tetratricopeptide (TPR) repeat protein
MGLVKSVTLLVVCTAGFTGAETVDELVENGHFRRARPLVEQRLKANPNDARANYLLAKIREAFGDRSGAVALLQKAVAFDAKNADYPALLGELYGRQAQSAVFRQLGLARKCKRSIDTAVSLDPGHLEANICLMMYLSEAPGILGGDKKRAAAIPDELGKRDPVKGWIARAHFAGEKGEQDKAENYYRQAVEADPQSFLAHTRYANALIDRKPPKLELAEKHSRAAKQLNAQHILPHILLAVSYAMGDRWIELDAALREAAKIVPDNLQPYYSVGRVLVGGGKEPQRAEAYLRKYIAQAPEGGAAPHAQAHWTLGLLYEKLGRKSDAVAELQKSVALQSDFEPARKDLKRLRG